MNDAGRACMKRLAGGVLLASLVLPGGAGAADKARHAGDVFQAIFKLPKLDPGKLEGVLGIKFKRNDNDAHSWQHYVDQPLPAPLASVRILEEKADHAKFFSLDFTAGECVPMETIRKQFGPPFATETGPEQFGPMMAGITTEKYKTPVGTLEIARPEPCVRGFVIRTKS